MRGFNKFVLCAVAVSATNLRTIDNGIDDNRSANINNFTVSSNDINGPSKIVNYPNYDGFCNSLNPADCLGHVNTFPSADYINTGINNNYNVPVTGTTYVDNVATPYTIADTVATTNVAVPYTVTDTVATPTVVSSDEKNVAMVSNDESKHANSYINGTVVEQLNETININNPVISRPNSTYIGDDAKLVGDYVSTLPYHNAVHNAVHNDGYVSGVNGYHYDDARFGNYIHGDGVVNGPLARDVVHHTYAPRVVHTDLVGAVRPVRVAMPVVNRVAAPVVERTTFGTVSVGPTVSEDSQVVNDHTVVSRSVRSNDVTKTVGTKVVDTIHPTITPTYNVVRPTVGFVRPTVEVRRPVVDVVRSVAPVRAVAPVASYATVSPVRSVGPVASYGSIGPVRTYGPVASYAAPIASYGHVSPIDTHVVTNGFNNGAFVNPVGGYPVVKSYERTGLLERNFPVASTVVDHRNIVKPLSAMKVFGFKNPLTF